MDTEYVLATPAGDGVDHGTESTNWEREEFGPNPSNGRNSTGKEGDVKDDCDEKENTSPVDTCSFKY